MDFYPYVALRGHMDKDADRIRKICTEIGVIMEDASVIALIWSGQDTISASNRLTLLRDAHVQIETLLDQAEDNT